MVELQPISDEELQIALDVSTKEFEDFARRDYDDESDLQYSAVETLSKRCIQIQIHIHRKNFDEVANIVAETYHLIQECIDKKYIQQDYVTGFRYIVKCLEIATSLELHKDKNTESPILSVTKLQDDLKQINLFSSLKLKDQVGVWALKQYFLGNVNRNVHDIQIQIIKKMITLDPNNPEWRSCLYAVCKFKREFAEKRGPPSEEEKLAILAAYEIPRAKFDPRIRLGYAYWLAELIRDTWRPFTAPLTFGRQQFFSVNEVIERIQEEVDDVLSIDPMSVRSNINVAKIYTSILPYPYRNVSFGMVCIKRALLFHPNSSKAAHRMGIIRLSKDSPTQAVKYFKKSFDCDERNFYALYDLLKSYIHIDRVKYRQDLSKLFDKVLSHNFYKTVPEKIAQIMFMKALDKFLDAQHNESVSLFIAAYLKHTKELFKDIERDIKRYSGLENKTILRDLQDFFIKEYNKCPNAKQKEILKILSEAAMGSSYGYRGSDGGSRGHRGSRGNNYSRGGFESRGRGSRGSYNNHYSQGGFGSRGSSNRNYNSQNGFNAGGCFGNSGKNENRRNGERNNQKKDENDGIFKYLKTQNHWAVLGVAKTATKAEIKTAYRKLAKETHPDKHMDAPESVLLKKQEEMKIINKAYEALIA